MKQATAIGLGHYDSRATGKRLTWAAKENTILSNAVQKFGIGRWQEIAKLVPARDPTQCSQHWKKVLDPNFVKGFWIEDEDELLLRLKLSTAQLSW
jgi:hypothetical protein